LVAFTIATLDQAEQLSGGQVFVVNWIAGVVHTELPGYFHQRNAAREELAWCLDHSDKAPHPAWLREVYFHLGKLALDNGDTTKAQEYLRRSGYSQGWASSHQHGCGHAPRTSRRVHTKHLENKFCEIYGATPLLP